MSDARKLPALLDFGAGYNPHPRVYHRHPSNTSKMHFHLATVLILIPLLTAAPTPKLDQREPVDVTKEVTGALGQLTGGLGKIPTIPTSNGKRADIAETLTTTLGGLTGGLTKLPGGKRQVPDVAKTLTDALNQITGGDITKLPTGGKREAPADITNTVTSTVESLTGGLTKLPGGKRQAPDVAGTLKSAVDVVLGQGNEVNPKQLLGKRDSIDVTKALGEIFDPVNEALKKDYSKDFTPGGPKKPVGKRNDGIDVTKTVGELLSPFNEALKNSKDYAENYKTQDNTKTPSEKRGGIDGTGTVAAVLDQVTNAIENSKDFKPSGLETPSQALQRRADVLGGLLGMLTGGLGGGLKPPGSSKRDETTDAVNSVPFAGALMQLAQLLGGGALKDGKVPADFKFPDGTQVPPMAGAEKRLDVASAAKGVVYEVIDGVTKPTKNL
ncbi:hypothetical protein V501_03227 [Pseudogymnoascus sp. VKM F-4519 (FW-2642)]|nr:hypothetical protein V501_03227 [Pseudogymnoascus sp. VKM F-4519 (FW-2642)]